MAVQIPTFADLPSLVPQPSGALPSFKPNDPVAEGEANLGQGFQKAGLAASDTDLYQQLAKDKLEEANATVDLFSRVDPIHQQMKVETDPAKLAGLRQQAQDILPISSQAIANPLRRQMWTAQHSRTVNELNVLADARNTELGREQAKADIRAGMDKAVRTAVGSPDPQAMDIAQGAINDFAQYGKLYGANNPVETYNLTKHYQAQLYVGKADQLIAQGRPDQASALLDAHREDIDAITLERLQRGIAGKANKITTDGAALRALGLPTTGLNVPVGSLPSGDSAAGDVGQRVAQTLRARGWSDAAVTGALNNAITESSLNPTAKGAAGEVGLFQFHPATHLPQFAAKSGGDFSPEAQANYVADVVEKTMPGYAKVDDAAQATTQFMRGFERPKDQSAAAAQARIANTAASSTAVAKVQPIPTGAEPAAQSEPQSQPAQSRTGLPSLTDAYMNILRDPAIKTDEQVRQAFGTATTIHNAMEADAARTERMQTQQQHAALKAREDQIWADAYSPQPKITAQQIAVDPAFSGQPERRKAMIELINNPPGSGVPAAQSYSAALSLIDRIRLPEGNADKITDEGQLYPLMRSMNRTDFDYVRKTLNDIRAPGGEALAKEEDRFFKEFGPFIDKSNPLTGTMDPSGKARLYEYHRWVDSKKDELKKAGKNPNDLFDPASPSYVGKPEILNYYQPTLMQSQQSIKDFAAGVPRPLPPLAPWNPPPMPPDMMTAPVRQEGESAEDYLKRTGQQ